MEICASATISAFGGIADFCMPENWNAVTAINTRTTIANIARRALVKTGSSSFLCGIWISLIVQPLTPLRPIQAHWIVLCFRPQQCGLWPLLPKFALLIERLEWLLRWAQVC